MNQTPSSLSADRIARTFEQPDWYLSGYAANIRVRYETVSAYSGNRIFSNVLDVGCGDGSLSLPFLSAETKVTYLDVSGAMLDRVKSRVPEKLLPQASFIKGDFVQIDLSANSFDLILFVGVFAYIKDIKSVVHRIKKFLRPGGLLIVECTDAAHPFARLNFSYRDVTAILRPAPCPTYRHRGSDIVKALQFEGFGLRQSFRYSYTLPILLRFTSQSRRYAMMRRFYGTAAAHRRQKFGSELLMLFDLP